MQKKLLEAIMLNYTLDEIAKASKVPKRTLYWRINNKPEYIEAKQKANEAYSIYLTVLQNMFEN